MKIYCTVKELGQLVRACEKGQCYACALRDVCQSGTMEQKTIEDFVTAETIMKEEADNGEIHADRHGVQPNHEGMLPCFEQG